MVKQIDYEQSLLLGKVRRANPKKKTAKTKNDLVARSMRRGERGYESAAGRYRDEDDDGDACW